MLNGPWKVGDRVVRQIDVYDDSSPVRRGTVTRRYSQDGEFDGVRWHDPEIYEVLWDDGTVGRGFFRHGLDPEKETRR